MLQEIETDEYEATEPNLDTLPGCAIQCLPRPPLGRSLQPKRLEMVTLLLRQCLDRLRATL